MEVLKLNMYWSSQKTVNSTLSGIYFIKNIINDQVYIGSSSNIYQRYLCHRGRLLNNKHHNKHLQYSINKYGIDNFEFQIIAECPKEKTYLEKLENFFLNTIKNKYNTAKVAANGTGKILTDLHKSNISKGNIGRIVTKETKEKIRVKHLGKSPVNKGVPTTEEQKIKISNSHKGKKLSKDTINKLRILNTGKTLTDSAKLKCSKASKKYWNNKGKSIIYLQILEMLKNNKTNKEIKSLLQISSSYISKVKKENKL